LLAISGWKFSKPVILPLRRITLLIKPAPTASSSRRPIRRRSAMGRQRKWCCGMAGCEESPKAIGRTFWQAVIVIYCQLTPGVAFSGQTLARLESPLCAADIEALPPRVRFTTDHSAAVREEASLTRADARDSATSVSSMSWRMIVATDRTSLMPPASTAPANTLVAAALVSSEGCSQHTSKL
jgi:hypothetical protein